MPADRDDVCAALAVQLDVLERALQRIEAWQDRHDQRHEESMSQAAAAQVVLEHRLTELEHELAEMRRWLGGIMVGGVTIAIAAAAAAGQVAQAVGQWWAALAP